jgi:hypothetical protein
MASESKMLAHCQRVYDHLYSKATDRLVDDEVQRIYEGFLTQTFAEAGVEAYYYTHVMNELKRMDCVRLLRRGGGKTPSALLLIERPDEDRFHGVFAARATYSPHELLKEEVARLKNRVDRVESLVYAITKQERTEE